ncbi:hypothetical protein TDB9533_01240 [Thalassocella blandensis]|nr:hypothetical protein TDB9533_01240 [Thalassocella blandensis]
MKAAQVLWTTALIAYILKRIDTKPGVFLGMFASEGAAKKFSLTKLKPIGKSTKPIAEKVDFSGSRKEGTSILRKEYDGGFLELMGSNAIWNVKSTTAHFVFVEEPDDANENLNDQGDSIKLLFERTKRVREPKKILGGTPSVKGFSRVEEYINLSDKRVFPIACHDCGEKHVLSFDNVLGWERDDTSGDKHPIYGHHDPDKAFYACPHCGSVWDDFQRRQNIRETVIAAILAGDPYFAWVPTRPSSKIAGFTKLNELYSCLPGVGAAQMVRDYLEAEYYAARGDTNKQIVFINSKLGEPYEFQDGRDDAESLRENANADPESQHRSMLCPVGGLIVTAGVDVQDNRLAIVIRAHGRDRRSWLLYADEIYAKVSTTNENDPVWDELDKILFGAIEHASGSSIYLRAITIDSGGHATDAVYNWVITRQKKYRTVTIMAGKGSSATSNPPVFAHPAPSKALESKRPDKLTKAEKKGVKLYIIGTQRGKDYIADQLTLNARGQNRFHFMREEDLRHDYFDQMLAESKIPDRSGRAKWKQKSGCPCEFWDCEVYAEHAARAVGVPHKTAKDWDNLEITLKQSDLFSEAAPLVPAAKPQPRERAPGAWQRRR